MRTIDLKRRCACCNDNKGELLFEVNFYDENEYLPHHYNIVCCNSCGFTFADSEASQDDYNRYYANCDEYAEDDSVKLGNLISGTTYEAIGKKIASFVKKDASIIDVGCGSGLLLALLKEYGFLRLTGFDPSIEAVSVLAKRGIEGRVGNIFENRDICQKYDLVLSTCVIEHIFDLNSYIENLKSFMHAKSVLFLALPAVEGFPDFICPRPNYFNQEHINYFTIGSLDNLMGKHNLRRINDDCFFIYNKEKYSFVIYEMSDEKKKIKKDEKSKEYINLYLDREREKTKYTRELINRIITEEKQIVVWGTGQFIKQVLSDTPYLIEKIAFFIDNNGEKQGKTIGGKLVWGAEHLYEHQDKEIVVASMLHFEMIKKQIVHMGLKNKITSLL